MQVLPNPIKNSQFLELSNLDERRGAAEERSEPCLPAGRRTRDTVSEHRRQPSPFLEILRKGWVGEARNKADRQIWKFYTSSASDSAVSALIPDSPMISGLLEVPSSFTNISRGLAPSPGPTMPFSSKISKSLEARA